MKRLIVVGLLLVTMFGVRPILASCGNVHRLVVVSQISGHP
jgi:hypothetical protein